MYIRCVAKFIQFYDRNKKGTDYVVGDIHGYYAELEALLVKFSFNPKHDRLFSVGDLVNKGPKSIKALEYLEKDWFHPVLGNHDVSVLGTLDDYLNRQTISKKDLQNDKFKYWIAREEKDKLKRLFNKMSRLPYAIEIATDKDPVGIVHAEVPIGMDWGYFKERLERSASVRDKATKTDFRINAFKRGTSQQGHNIIHGVHRLFVGHAPLPETLELDNILYIDTGIAGESETAALTMVNIHVDLKMQDQKYNKQAQRKLRCT